MKAVTLTYVAFLALLLQGCSAALPSEADVKQAIEGNEANEHAANQVLAGKGAERIRKTIKVLRMIDCVKAGADSLVPNGVNGRVEVEEGRPAVLGGGTERKVKTFTLVNQDGGWRLNMFQTGRQ